MEHTFHNIIYLYGNDWLIVTGADGVRWLRLEMENGTRVNVQLPEEKAQEIVNAFVAIENMKHEAQIDKITNRKEQS